MEPVVNCFGLHGAKGWARGNVACFRSLAQRPQSLGRGKVPEQEPVSGKGETIERARGKKMVAKTVGLRRQQQAEGALHLAQGEGRLWYQVH